MKLKALVKGLLATSALALAIIVTPASDVKAAESTYTVEKNDNLSKIAKKVYGDERLWKVIYNANSGVVKSNYIIYKGQVLIIPTVNDTATTIQTSQISTPAPQVQTPEPQQTQTPEPQQTQTPEPQQTQTPTTQVPTPEQSQVYALDYNAIAAWVDGGFIGNDASGAPAVMAIDKEADYGIIIFGDNSDMTAVSFIGPITYAGSYATITDEANGLALTFEISGTNGTIILDMGDIGTVTFQAAAKETVLNEIKIGIENYTHIG